MYHTLQKIFIKIEFRIFRHAVSSLQSIYSVLNKMLKCYFKNNVSAIIWKRVNFYTCTRDDWLSHLCGVSESKKASQKLNNSVFLETLIKLNLLHYYH